MKKQLLYLLLLFAFTFANAQQIQDSNFEASLTVPANCNAGESSYNEAQPARTQVIQDDGSWYRCGGVTIEPDGAEGNVLVSVTSKTPSIRQTISNQVTVGDAIAANTFYRVTVRLRNRGAHVSNTNSVNISFRDIDNLDVRVPGIALIWGEDPTLMLNGTNDLLTIPYDSFDNTGYSTFEFAFQTPSPLPIGSDLLNETTPVANYHEGVAIQIGRPKSGTDTADDIFFAEVSMVADATAGIEDLQKFKFSYAPNPSRDFVRLSAANNIENVEIFNLLGQKLISKDLNSNNENVDISNLVKGVYLMNVTIDGNKGSFKIIKE